MEILLVLLAFCEGNQGRKMRCVGEIFVVRPNDLLGNSRFSGDFRRHGDRLTSLQRWCCHSMWCIESTHFCRTLLWSCGFYTRWLYTSWTERRITLQWRRYGLKGVSNHRRLDCLLNPVFRRRSKKAPKIRVTGLCEGNSPVMPFVHLGYVIWYTIAL